MLADQANRRLGIVEGDGDDIGQHIVRRTLCIRHRDRRIAAPGFRHGIEADFGIVIGAVIGALAFCDLRPPGKRPRRLQRHHHGLGAGIGEPHLLDRGQARRQQFRQIDLGLRRQPERRSQRQLFCRSRHQRGMGVAVDQRGEVVDAVDIAIAVDIEHPATLAARSIDRIGLHEHGGAGVAAGQAGKRAGVEVLGLRFRVRVHAWLSTVLALSSIADLAAEAVQGNRRESSATLSGARKSFAFPRLMPIVTGTTRQRGVASSHGRQHEISISGRMGNASQALRQDLCQELKLDALQTRLYGSPAEGEDWMSTGWRSPCPRQWCPLLLHRLLPAPSSTVSG